MAEINTIKELRKSLDEKKIGACELAAEYIKKAKEDKRVNAYVRITEEEALKRAEAAQKVIDSGGAKALTGIPFAVKDNICTKNVITSCASKMLENFAPPYNASVIDALESENYVPLGKANMDEFAMGGSTLTSAFAQTRNPHDAARVAGGSSGGSAAAVAGGFAPAALGSDTGGSVRQPAAFCGVCGLKPTYGRVSRYGLIAFGSSLDQIGVLANTSEDCGIVMNTIAFFDPKDGTSKRQDKTDFTAKVDTGVKGLKIALPPEFFTDVIDEDVKTAVLGAAKILEARGAVLINDVSMGKALEYAVPAYYLISSAEAASNLSRYDGLRYGLAGTGKTYDDIVRDSRGRGFGDEVKRRILLGNYALSSGYYDAYYRKALALRQEIGKTYSAIFEKADVILTPTAPTAAYKADGSQNNSPTQMYMADICTVTVNLAGLPAISVPCGKSDNMPIGVSVIGRKFDEVTVIGAGSAIERGRSA